MSTEPEVYHVLAKPTGARCNLDCKYCFFLSKENLYPGDRSRMSDETMESHVRQLLEPQHATEVTIAWQGGEPTLMGLDFFRRSIEVAAKYRKPGQKILHTMQTNGVVLDDEWCVFLKEHGFLVGLSVDGPREMHDAYRITKGGAGTFDQVMSGLEALQRHQVDVNILCSIHAANADHPLEVYRVNLGKGLLVGLELLVVADIIRTVVLDLTPLNIATLAALVLVRTFLGWTLAVEVEGRWSWGKKEEAGPSAKEGMGTILPQGATALTGAARAETER